MESPLTSVKRRIAHAWVGHMQRVANRNSEEVRRLQTESGRTKKLLLKFDAFENDVTKRGFIPQVVFTYFTRVVDGHMEVTETAGAWDGHVMTDIPVLVGLRDGYMDKVLADGTVVRIEPFTPRRAWLMGRILTEGDAGMLSNLLLLETRIWGDLLKELQGTG